eukprot:GILI01004567.1.p1 GENE.GILI01004567.1~~GILI01004567.1.p1  ORF type:complete len:438 (+),score=130.07 GILI01004567.1:129-1442(+)
MSSSRLSIDGYDKTWQTPESAQARLAELTSPVEYVEIVRYTVHLIAFGAIADFLKTQSSSLKSIDISCNPLSSSENVRRLADLIASSPNLRILNLANMHLGPECFNVILPSLASLTNLTELHVAGNSLTLQNLSDLASTIPASVSLSIFDVSFNEIGSEGFEALLPLLNRSAPTLRQLRLHSCRVGSPGLASLSELLSSAPLLEDLDIAHNSSIKEENVDEHDPIFDAAVISVMQSLASTRSIRSLDLTRNLVSTSCCVECASSFSQLSLLQSVSLFAEMTTTSMTAIVNALGQLAQLEEVKAIGVEHNFDDKVAEAVASSLLSKENASIVSLSLNSGFFTQNGLVTLFNALASNSSLRVLKLQDAYLADETASALAKSLKANRTLKVLNTEGFVNAKGPGVQAVNAALVENIALEEFNQQQILRRRASMRNAPQAH